MFLLAKNQLPNWNEVYIRFLSPNNVTHLISVKKSIKAFIYSCFFVEKLWLMSPTNVTKNCAKSNVELRTQLEVRFNSGCKIMKYNHTKVKCFC